MLSIDITDKQVKLVRGSLVGNKIRVIEVDTRELTAGAVVNGYIADIPMIAAEITDIISSRGIKEKEAIVCINSSSILYKELVLPKPKKITNTAAIEAMITSNMGISNDYNISYSIVGEEQDENQNSVIKLMATACPQRMVDGYIKLFTHLGLSLKQINISNNCITRLILNTQKLSVSMPLMLVQIDTDFLNINLYEKDQVSMSRYIKIDASDYNNDPDYINRAVYENLYRMVTFIGQRKDAMPLKEIMFYGYIKDFIALTNAISSFNIPAHILSLPNNIVTFCDLDFSKYANAIGAFHKVRKGLDHVNLLDSTAVKEKKSVNKYYVQLGVSVLVSVGLIAGATLGIDVINNDLKGKIKVIDDEINSPELQNRVNVLNTKITVLTNFDTYKIQAELAKDLFDYKPKLTTDVLNKIQEVMPDGMSINGEVSLNEYSVSLTLECDDAALPTQYVRALIEQDYFENILYTGYTMKSQGEEGAAPKIEGYTFDLTMQLKGGNGVEIK